MPDLKDNAAIQFSKAVEKVQRELVNQILDLKNQGYTKNEMLLILQALDMEDMILNRLNLNADIDKLMLSYEKVLAGMEMTGAVSNESLTALLRMDRAKFAAEAGIMGNTIRTETCAMCPVDSLSLRNVRLEVSENYHSDDLTTAILAP